MTEAKTVEELIAVLQALPNQKAKISYPLWIGKDATIYKKLSIDIGVDDRKNFDIRKVNDSEWVLIKIKEDQ